MNANAIWAGNDYAYVEDRGRGKGFIPGAARVKVMRVYKRKADYLNERLSAYAEVQYLNRDGTPRASYAGSPLPVREVRVRDIISLWEEYEVELKEHEAKEQERQAKIDEQREQRRQESAAILDALTDKGLPADAVTSINDRLITLRKEALVKWLGL